MGNVIVYTRVSTDEQAESGYSLGYQKDRLNEYCKINGYKIVKHFQEDYSAKNFDRPEWNKLHQYVKSNRRSIDKILILKWDRFSRNQEEALRVIREYGNWGIDIDAIEQPLDLSIPENKAMLSFYLVIPEIDNDRRSDNVRKGNRKALEEGWWINHAPYGYVNKKVDMGGKKPKPVLEIHPEESVHVIKAFEEVAKGVESANSVMQRLRKDGMKLKKSNFLRMLRKPIYMGKIVVPEYKKEPELLVDGRHEALIDAETFYKVQVILDGKRWKGIVPSHRNELFPLRNYLICDETGENMTASSPTGRGGKKHHYYHNRSKESSIWIKRDDVHGMFNDLLSSLTINSNVKDLYKEMIHAVAKDSAKEKLKAIKVLQTKIEENETMLINIEDRLASGDIKADTFARMNERYLNAIRDYKAELEGLKEEQSPLEEYIDKGLALLTNLDEVYENSSYENKRVLLGAIFPEKLRISKTECRTTTLNTVVELLCRNNGKSTDIKKGTKPVLSGLSPSVPRAGVEPARPRAQDFESSVSTNFTIQAFVGDVKLELILK